MKPSFVCRVLCAAALVAHAGTVPAAAMPQRADFGAERPSTPARQLADWVVATGDHQHRPFAMLDKRAARIYVFDAQGRLTAASAALLGLARGDDTVPGIGTRKMSDIRPHERTTPAGRFVLQHGRNMQGEDILWVDYEAAVSLHRLRANDPTERRQQRLASPTPSDNRISYGCINVPATFYDQVLLPAFAATRGVIYVLPEKRPAREVFGL